MINEKGDGFELPPFLFIFAVMININSVLYPDQVKAFSHYEDDKDKIYYLWTVLEDYQLVSKILDTNSKIIVKTLEEYGVI